MLKLQHSSDPALKDKEIPLLTPQSRHMNELAAMETELAKTRQQVQELQRQLDGLKKTTDTSVDRDAVSVCMHPSLDSR